MFAIYLGLAGVALAGLVIFDATRQVNACW